MSSIHVLRVERAYFLSYSRRKSFTRVIYFSLSYLMFSVAPTNPPDYVDSTLREFNYGAVADHYL